MSQRCKFCDESTNMGNYCQVCWNENEFVLCKMCNKLTHFIERKICEKCLPFFENIHRRGSFFCLLLFLFFVFFGCVFSSASSVVPLVGSQSRASDWLWG